jgi:release factor glutamine methyltransferase
MQNNRLSATSVRREPIVLSVTVAGDVLWQWRHQAQIDAIAAQVPPAEVDWLLRSLTNLEALDLRLESFRTWPAVSLTCSLVDLDAWWRQRLVDRMPIQYLVGFTPWRDFILQVSPDVLIPRPETEDVIDLAAVASQTLGLASTPVQHWADLGTGSGAIALGLATAFPQAHIHAVDISPAALAIAQANALAYGLSDRIHFYSGSWFAPLTALKGKLTGFISNPPYIPSPAILDLQPEVQQHEPHLALDGGDDGLACVRHLIDRGADYLVPDGIWMVELMAGQAQTVVGLLQQQGHYHQMEIHPDLAGIDRFVLAHRRKR